jgi:hypothetical protein
LITCAWIETSSAETGSSQTISRDALALAAGELMRKVLHLVGPQADLLEQFRDPILLFYAAREAVHGERLADDVARRHARVE